MKTFFTTLTLFLFSLFITKGQDIHFSQFTMTPLALDPSQAGKFGGDQRAIVNYKNQWSSIANPYVTYGLSFDSRLSKKDNFLAGGLMIYNDKAGDINMGQLSANLVIAYHIKSGRNGYFSAGLSGGILQHSINQANLRYDNQYDGVGHNPSLSSNEIISRPSFIQPDFSAGISYSYGDNSNRVVSNNGYDGKKINIGASVQHVNKPNFSFLEDNFERRALKYVMLVNTSFGVLNTNTAIQPSGIFTYQQSAIDFIFGTFFRYTMKEKSRFTKFSNGAAVSLGTHYRFSDAFILSTLLETGSFAFGLSYDFNLSGLSVASNGRGGLEVSIRYITPNPFGTRRTQARFF